MSIAFVAAAGLLAAFALAIVALCFGLPIGRLSVLWQSVSREERIRFGLLSPASERLLGWLFVIPWLLRAVSASAADLLTRFGLPATAFFRSPLAASLSLLFYGVLLVHPLLWSWRVLRLPPGTCSAALRQLAMWTFPLCVGALVICTLLLFWASHLPSTAKWPPQAGGWRIDSCLHLFSAPSPGLSQERGNRFRR